MAMSDDPKNEEQALYLDPDRLHAFFEKHNLYNLFNSGSDEAIEEFEKMFEEQMAATLDQPAFDDFLSEVNIEVLERSEGKLLDNIDKQFNSVRQHMRANLSHLERDALAQHMKYSIHNQKITAMKLSNAVQTEIGLIKRRMTRNLYDRLFRRIRIKKMMDQKFSKAYRIFKIRLCMANRLRFLLEEEFLENDRAFHMQQMQLLDRRYSELSSAQELYMRKIQLYSSTEYFVAEFRKKLKEVESDPADRLDERLDVIDLLLSENQFSLFASSDRIRSVLENSFLRNESAVDLDEVVNDDGTVTAKPKEMALGLRFKRTYGDEGRVNGIEMEQGSQQVDSVKMNWSQLWKNVCDNVKINYHLGNRTLEDRLMENRILFDDFEYAQDEEKRVELEKMRNQAVEAIQDVLDQCMVVNEKGEWVRLGSCREPNHIYMALIHDALKNPSNKLLVQQLVDMGYDPTPPPDEKTVTPWLQFMNTINESKISRYRKDRVKYEEEQARRDQGDTGPELWERMAGYVDQPFDFPEFEGKVFGELIQEAFLSDERVRMGIDYIPLDKTAREARNQLKVAIVNEQDPAKQAQMIEQLWKQESDEQAKMEGNRAKMKALEMELHQKRAELESVNNRLERARLDPDKADLIPDLEKSQAALKLAYAELEQKYVQFEKETSHVMRLLLAMDESLTPAQARLIKSNLEQSWNSAQTSARQYREWQSYDGPYYDLIQGLAMASGMMNLNGEYEINGQMKQFHNLLDAYKATDNPEEQAAMSQRYNRMFQQLAQKGAEVTKLMHKKIGEAHADMLKQHDEITNHYDTLELNLAHEHLFKPMPAPSAPPMPRNGNNFSLGG